jgi:hypothetical protein
MDSNSVPVEGAGLSEGFKTNKSSAPCRPFFAMQLPLNNCGSEKDSIPRCLGM